MYRNKVMYGFEYIYQASRITKTAIILGIFIIIGLATRNWSGEIDPGKVQLEDEIAHKYTGPHIGKKIKAAGKFDNIKITGTDNIEDSIDYCADTCITNKQCGGFNFIGNKCEFIAGELTTPMDSVEEDGVVSFIKTWL
ncbi:hypothetical protein EhVM1_000463 [Emiliania huxleyi virus M1]|nr:hypothetical protein EhVM1_000463 [Emiliania huxleyi virus M1]|mmetsp:Transcript_22810/g.65125  ORF Transcript_22810/g.65125 Transcript_22810/m.65125 type:complete len:139 (+) Transcript_22810:943-1359(+)